MDLHQLGVSALILWRSGLVLPMNKFRQLPATHPCFHFWMITLVNINGVSPNLVCALILWRSGLGVLKGKLSQFLTALSPCEMSIFSFPSDNFSKFQWIFTKLDMCIDIVEI